MTATGSFQRGENDILRTLGRRTMPTKRIAALAGVAALAISATAPAVTTQSVEFQVRYSGGAKHKSRAGTSLRTILRISDPDAKAPLRLTRTVLRFPKGT